MDMRELSTEAENIIEPAQESYPEVAEETVATDTPVRQSLTRQEIVEKIAGIAEADAAEISREEVSHLKMLFYSLRNAEGKAETADEEIAENALAEEAADADVPEPVADPLEEKLKEYLGIIRDKKARFALEEENRRRENLERKNAIVEEIVAAYGDTDNVGRLFGRVKELQEEFKTVGEVPQTEATAIWKKYQDAVETFYDRLKINKELRDYDFRKNLEQKELIISQARTLLGTDDVVVAFRRLQELHDKWRETGPVAKEERDRVWAEFKEISTEINKQYQNFFEQKKQRETDNENAKTAICERIEAILADKPSSFKTWEAATAEVLSAQTEWKTLGYASRKMNNALYDRYRKLCDEFFAAKAAYYKEVKEAMDENLRRKTALAEEAETLAQSDDFRAATDRILLMQKEWRTIGAVPKKVSDAVWKRFTAACDTFFERKKKATGAVRSQEQENLAAKKAVIESLKAITPETDRAEGVKILRDAMSKWGKIGHVPFREKDKIYNEYRALVDALYESLDMRGNGAAMNRFEENLRRMEGDRNAVNRERERLVRAFEARKNELATAENNMGFFTSKSRSGDSMIKEMERRISRLKEDIEQLEKKIRILDGKL